MLPVAVASRPSLHVLEHVRAGTGSLLPSPPACKLQPLAAVCLSVALNVSLQAPACADVERAVSTLHDNDAVEMACGVPDAKYGTRSGTSASITLDVADDGQLSTTCPEFSGLRKYICYGPCCGLPWGPGGPICLALAGAAFRYGMPYTLINWVRSEDAELPGKLDANTLAFSAALFLSAAPRTAEGFAFSFLFVVICLL